MDPRTTLRRTVAASLVMIVIGCAGWSPSARAQSGSGLYEPFPEAAVKKRAQRYVESLRGRTPGAERRFSNSDLARGVFVDHRAGALVQPPANTAGAASARSGAEPATGVALPVQLLLLLAVLLLPAVALARRAHARAT
jgi:hypothetical protein